MGAYDALNLNSCETLYAQGTARSPRRTSPTTTARRSSPGETCTTGSSSISGVAFYTGDAVPGRVPGRAVLRRLLAQLHLGRCYKGAERAAGPGDARRRSLPARPARSGLTAGPGRRALLRRPRGRHRAPDRGRQQRADGAHHRDAFVRRRAADRRLRRHGSTDPEGQALTYAWDLDGDGAYDDSTAATPSFTYTAAGIVTVRLRVTDAGGSQRHDEHDDHRRRAARR